MKDVIPNLNKFSWIHPLIILSRRQVASLDMIALPKPYPTLLQSILEG